MEGAMWMEALLLTPYLVLASSGLLIAAVVAICWTQSFPPRPPLPAHLDRRHRRRSGQRLSGVARRVLRIAVSVGCAKRSAPTSSFDNRHGVYVGTALRAFAHPAGCLLHSAPVTLVFVKPI
jgi:hypothetical protein